MNVEKINIQLFISSFIILLLSTILLIIDHSNNNIISILNNGFNLQAIIAGLTFILSVGVMSITSYILIKESRK